MTTIQKINPINKDEEKTKFFFDPLYNPQFEYEEEFDDDEYYKYGQISNELLDQATYITDAVIKKYGSETKYLEEVEGRILTQEEAKQEIVQYLETAGFDHGINIEYSNNFVSRTSMYHNTLRIRTPMEYRQYSLKGVLDHEISTHYLRYLNDQKQPWHNKRTKFQIGSYADTEEGIAILNQYLKLDDKHLWISSLYYLATWYGFHHSFSELNEYMTKFIDDKERRWKMCLRIKRGVKDTSQPGAFTRNQMYLQGAAKVGRFLVESEFDLKPLYVGKVSLEDGQKLLSVIKSQPELPYFYTQDAHWYKEQVKKILSVNKLI